jgi:hypothetical protein
MAAGIEQSGGAQIHSGGAPPHGAAGENANA